MKFTMWLPMVAFMVDASIFIYEELWVMEENHGMFHQFLGQFLTTFQTRTLHSKNNVTIFDNYS